MFCIFRLLLLMQGSILLYIAGSPQDGFVPGLPALHRLAGGTEAKVYIILSVFFPLVFCRQGNYIQEKTRKRRVFAKVLAWDTTYSDKEQPDCHLLTRQSYCFDFKEKLYRACFRSQLILQIFSVILPWTYWD